jgi:hypothetical protein
MKSTGDLYLPTHPTFIHGTLSHGEVGVRRKLFDLLFEFRKHGILTDDGVPFIAFNVALGFQFLFRWIGREWPG